MEETKEKINLKQTGITGLWARLRALYLRAGRYIYGHVWLSLGLCAALMVLMTMVKFRIFPESAFKDAQFIIGLALSGDLAGIDPAYTLIAKAFAGLYELTGITSLAAWGWILLVPGAAMALYLIYKARPQSVAALFVACCFSVLLPFYVFMIGKDFLQFTVFFIIALLLLNLKKEWLKAAAAILLLIPVVLLFRSYYVLMIGFIVLFYVFALIYRRMLTFKARTVCLMGTAIAVVAGLYIIRFGFPGRAMDLFGIRSVVNASYGRTSDTDKVIMDLLPLERSVPGFLANYLLAGVRMVLPFELIKSTGDIPFTVFQIALTVLFIMELIKSRRVQARTAIYSVALAFFFMSFVFEPDFASWFRHETAAFPIIWLALGSDVKTMRGVNMGDGYGI